MCCPTLKRSSEAAFINGGKHRFPGARKRRAELLRMYCARTPTCWSTAPHLRSGRPCRPPLSTLFSFVLASPGSGARATEGLATDAAALPGPPTTLHQGAKLVSLPASACSGPESSRAGKGRAVLPLQWQSRSKLVRVGGTNPSGPVAPRLPS